MNAKSFMLNILSLLKSLPQKPGVYIFKDQRGRILYIGKAQNIKKRVSSYFQKSKDLWPNKRSMIEKIESIDYIITFSETEALLLENNLIKKYRPRYNIVFKDDKQYKYIKIDYTDDFPRLYTVRKIEKGPASYFGPFTDGLALKQTLQLLRKLFPFRDCNQNIFVDNMHELKRKACLRYHIKRCLGPCIGKVSKEEYNQVIRSCLLFLQGKQEKIIKNLKRQMKKAAQKQDFEHAAILRDQVKNIEKIIAKQIIISPKPLSQDVISFIKNERAAYFNLFAIREGKLLGKENFTLKIPQQSKNEEILSSFIKHYYSETKDLPKEIILPNEMEEKESIEKWLKQLAAPGKIKITIAKKGRKKRLIQMGIENIKSEIKKRKKDKNKNGLDELAKTLGLKKAPKRIECYDISFLFGKEACGSMVVFENNQIKKSEYRRFKIRNPDLKDDLGMLKEVLTRRFSMAKEKGKSWSRPDLIVIDGGKGQLFMTLKVLAKLKLDIPAIALAKKEEKIYLPQERKPVILPRSSKALHLLQQIRDESHRFAISYHRKLRKKRSLASFLDQIKGIGPKRKKDLILTFRSPEKIRKAKEKDLEKIVGKKIAKAIKNDK